jgi:putative hydrolase of the HAD superfamily
MKPRLISRIKELSTPLRPIPTGAPIHLEPIDGVTSVLFDVYGTLLISGSGDVGTAAAADSSEALAQALTVSGYEGDVDRAGELGPGLLQSEIRQWHQTAKESGIDSPEVEISQIWARLMDEFCRLNLLTPDENPDRILRLAIEYECRVNPVWPMPGAAETIRFLKERGIRLGIVSNAQFYTPLILEALFGKSLESLGFDPALCVWSYREHRAKPSEELFQKLTSETDLSAALYVGNDMLNDIWTASRAGCRTVLFAGDKRSLRLRKDDKRCKSLRPTATTDDLRQITEMI